MASYKEHKLIKIVQEFENTCTRYNINGIDTEKAIFFYRAPQQQFQEFPKGSYKITTESNNVYFDITDTTILFERVQICYQFASISSDYNVDFNVDINVLKDRYNEVVADVKSLFTYIQTNMMVADAYNMSVVLPELNKDEVWVKTADGWRALNIENLEDNIRQLLIEIDVLKKTIFKEMLDTKNKYIAEIDGKFNTEVANGRAALEATTLAGNNSLTNTTTQGNESLTATTNAGKEAITTVYNNAVSDFNSLAITKNNELTTNANNLNASITTTGNTKIAEVIAEGDKQVARIGAKGQEEYDKLIATGVDSKVSKGGDLMTGALTISKTDVLGAELVAEVNNTAFGIGITSTDTVQYGKVISKTDSTWNTVQDLTHNFMGRMTIYGNTQSDPCLLTLRGTTVDQDKEASIKFTSDDDPDQAVLLKYNAYDDIRAPFGLNVCALDSSFGKAYLDVEGVIYAGDRICVNNRIDAKGQYGSWEEQAPANYGFSVNDGFGGPLYIDVTAGGKAIKGYGIYTTQNALGYASYSWLGHLREGGSSPWGSTVLYFDPEGNPGKFWRFNHDTGDFVSPGNVIAYSDIKLKKDLEIIPNPIDKILSLTGYNYTRRDTNERQTGLIAQEVQKVMPEAVSQYADMNGEATLGVSYGNLVGLLIEGIKELKLEVDRLKHALGEVK